MADSPTSAADRWIDRTSKLAGIFVPVVLAWYAQRYTAQKDASDRQAQLAQQARDDYLKAQDRTSRKYQNLTSLVPLLTSKDKPTVQVGLDILSSEAKAQQAPDDLQATIDRIVQSAGADPASPQLKEAADRAKSALAKQIDRERCFSLPDGVYIHVLNAADQKAAWDGLARRIATSDLPAQGVQRVDASPDKTQIRYYFTPENTKRAAAIAERLRQLGIPEIDMSDLSPRYLSSGCTAPEIFEVWVGKNDRFASDGTRL
jgi:hypothetical protein